jgi:hypothetical protein
MPRQASLSLAMSPSDAEPDDLSVWRHRNFLSATIAVVPTMSHIPAGTGWSVAICTTVIAPTMLRTNTTAARSVDRVLRVRRPWVRPTVKHSRRIWSGPSG